MINSKIRELRKAKGWSQLDMAEKLHMSQTAYSSLELNDSKVDIERFVAICQIFEIGPEELLSSAGVTFNFNEKLENCNAFGANVENLYFENKELVVALMEQLKIKDGQIEQLLSQNQQLLKQIQDLIIKI